MRFSRFRTSRNLLGPAWLTSDGESELVGYSLDIVKDAFVERIQQGAYARLPFQDPNHTVTSPADALVAHGQTRRVVRGKFDTDAQYAERLLTWLDDSRFRGSAFALLLRLREYVGESPITADSPKFAVYTTRNWYSLDSSGDPTKHPSTTWLWDSGASARQWGRFWVVIWPGTSGLAATQTVAYGDAGAWYGREDLLYGASTITESDAAALKRIVREWKPAGTKCVSLSLDFDVTHWTTLVTSGDHRTWGKATSGVYAPHRLATLTYTEGI